MYICELNSDEGAMLSQTSRGWVDFSCVAGSAAGRWRVRLPPLPASTLSLFGLTHGSLSLRRYPAVGGCVPCRCGSSHAPSLPFPPAAAAAVCPAQDPASSAGRQSSLTGLGARAQKSTISARKRTSLTPARRIQRSSLRCISSTASLLSLPSRLVTPTFF